MKTMKSMALTALMLAASAVPVLCREPASLSVNDPDEVVEVGDMLLEPGQAALTDAPHRPGKGVPGHASGIPFWAQPWPEGELPVVFDESIGDDEQALFFASCREWERRVGVHCVRRTDQDVYVEIVRGNGCYSRVGYGFGFLRFGGARTLSLASGCWDQGIITHELGHAFGLMHEQMRPDRDDYITVLWDNIELLQLIQYFRVPGYTFGLPYDFDSIMHYWSGAFASEPGLDTFVGKPGYEEAAARAGGRRLPSDLDARGLQMFYGPPGRIKVADGGALRKAKAGRNE